MYILYYIIFHNIPKHLWTRGNPGIGAYACLHVTVCRDRQHNDYVQQASMMCQSMAVAQQIQVQNQATVRTFNEQHE